MWRAWLISLVIVWWAGAATAAPRVFWYFDNATGNTSQRTEQIAEVASYTSHTMSVQYWETDDWKAAKAAGVRVVLSLAEEVFWAVSDVAPQSPALTLPMWCRTTSWCNRTLQDWIALITEHRDQVDIIILADELDCNTDDGSVRFPNWTLDSCRRAAAKLTVLHAAVKAWFPWAKTWANYTSAWAYYYHVARDRGVAPSTYGVSLAPSDYVSFDCYQPFDRCFGRTSASTLINAWKPFLSVHQRVLLLPRAFTGPYLGWDPVQAELTAMTWDYWRYAQTEIIVEGLVPFLYRSAVGMRGVRDTPWLGALYAQIGGEIRLQRPPRPPQGIRFLR